MNNIKLERILYVEDDPDVRTIAGIALEIVGGLNVKICSSGVEALEAADSFKPDLLLLDVLMPGMDGLMTLAGLRKILSTTFTPVIFMTAKVQVTEIENYKSLGILGIIAKPFDPMNLAARVISLWNKSINNNQNHHENQSDFP